MNKHLRLFVLGIVCLLTTHISQAQLTTELEHDRLNFFEGLSVDAVLRYTGLDLIIDNNEAGGDLFIQSAVDVDIEGLDDVIIEGRDDIFLATNNATRLFINEIGNVGLGTTSPDSRLDVNGDISMTDGTGRIDFKEGTTVKAVLSYNGASLNLETDEVGGDIIIDAADDIFFQPGGTTKAYFNQAGDFGIGTTAPSAKMEILHNSSINDAHLELFENAADFARLKFRSNPVGTTNDSKYWDVAGLTGASGSNFFNLWFWNGSSGNNFFSIDPDNNNIRIDGDIIPLGNVQYDLGNNNATEHWDDVVGDDFINFSDKRLKQNIKSVGSIIPELMKLNPVTYEYIESHNPDGRKRTGFIAQEMQKIFPQVVIDEDVDFDEATKKVVKQKSEHLAMNYMELIPITIKAVQEQQAMISDRDAKIQQLELELSALKATVESLVLKSN